MRLLVACPYFLKLIDTHTRESWVVHEAVGCGYYGVSWTPDGQHLALSHAVPEAGNELEHYMDSECGYITLGGRRGVDCLASPHQLVCDRDFVLVANTGRNCLTVVRRDDLFFKHVWFDEARWNRKGHDRMPGKHLNSVHVKGDRLYMLAHNFNRGSLIAELTYPGFEFVGWTPTKGHQAHNLWLPDGGPMLTCNTMDGSVIEAVSGRVLFRSAMPARMTRGLACHGKYVFVGMSQLARRHERGLTDGGIWILDRDTWKEIDFIPLPAAGNVREIRIVDAADECHHGHVLKNVPVPIAAATAEYREKAAAAVKRVSAAQEPWTVFAGKPTFSGNDVEATPGGGLTLAMCNIAAVADVAVSARLDAAPQAEHKHAGLIARYSGPGDSNTVCALVEVVAPYPFASLWQNVGGNWKQLTRARIGRLPAVLRLEAVGPQLTLFVDNKRVLTTKTDVMTAGTVGVRGLTGRYGDFKAEAIRGGKREPIFPPAAAKAA